MTAHVSKQSSVKTSEREQIDYLVKHILGYRGGVVINYYVALRSKRFMILTGPQDVDKMSLAQGVAQALVGHSSLQWSRFDAHPYYPYAYALMQYLGPPPFDGPHRVRIGTDVGRRL